MERISRRTALALAAGVATNVVLAACGDDDDTASTDGAETTPAPGTTDAATPATSAAAAATSAPAATTATTAPGEEDIPPLSAYDLDATVRFMWAAPPTRYDPHRATASYDAATLNQVYDRLVNLSPLGVPTPSLATAWEFDATGAALDMTLREGVVFHDGTPFDAEAAKANLERAKTVEGSAVASELAVVDTVEVVAPYAIRLNLNAPAAQLPAVLSDRAGMMVSPAAFANPDLDLAPVGAGMFKVTEYVPGDHAVYERFAEYWAPDDVRCARLEIAFSFDSLTRFNALRTGEIDGTVVGAMEDPEAEAAGLQMVRRAGLEFHHVQLNRSYEPFANADVRRAMNHAIDRQTIVDTLLLGLGVPSSQSFPEGYAAFDETTGTDSFPYDPELAKELLATAGYPDGFEFEMLYQISPANEQLALAIAGQLGEVGITANVRAIEPVQAGDIFYVRQESNALAALWGGRPDATQTFRLLYSDTGFSNPGRHTTPEMMAAIDATAEIQPEEERNAALQAASAQVVADVLDVVTYFPITSYSFSQDVLGVERWGFGRPDFRYVGMAAS